MEGGIGKLQKRQRACRPTVEKNLYFLFRSRFPVVPDACEGYPCRGKSQQVEKLAQLALHPRRHRRD